MSKDEILQKVVEILTPYSDEPEAMPTATPEQHLKKELGVDSSHMVDASMEFEDEFGIELTDEEVVTFKHMHHVIDMIAAKLDGR